MSAEPLQQTSQEPGPKTGVLRRLLLGILLLGLIGTPIDLLLLDHYADVWQLIPLVFLGLTLILLGWHVFAGSAASVRALQAALIALILGGVTGGVLHYRASAAFHLEMEPAPRGAALVWAVLRSKVPPLLAPAAMIQIGLIGLAYTTVHPGLRRGVADGRLGDSE